MGKKLGSLGLVICLAIVVSAVVQAKPKKKTAAQDDWARWEQVAWEGAKKSINTIWLKSAGFRNVTILGKKAIGNPGCLWGPEIESFMKTHMISRNVPDRVARRFSQGVSESWKNWESNVIVPGLNWYPSFDNMPSAMAPITQNTPSQLSKLPSSGEAFVSRKGTLKTYIQSKFGSEGFASNADTAIDAFAKRFTERFKIWKTQVVVTGVKGTGPVPSFAPPFKPFGMVEGGHIIPEPHFVNAVAF